MDRLTRFLGELHHRSVWQVIGIYLATSWAVLNAVDVLTGFAGLPDWTPTMAVVLLLIGFPIVTATAVIQKGLPGGDGPSSASDHDSLADDMNTTDVDGSGGAAERPTTDSSPAASANPGSPADGSRWKALFTWRNALMGGAAAGVLLLASGGAYLAMWSLGIGPVGSLVAQGVLDARDPILLVDFEDGAGVDDLGAVVAEALSVDLGASPHVSLVGDDAVQRTLGLMDRTPSSPMTRDVAREVAVRLNLKAFIDGEVTRVGSRYLIVARIVNPVSGENLASFREEAASDDDLLAAIDRLSQRLREKLGESLREIRVGPPLEQITTSSLEALRKLAQAERAEEEGDSRLAVRLAGEAIELDPEFAMAYRKLSVLLFNAGEPGFTEAAAMAYEHRDRLTDPERYLTEANYHTNVTLDDRAALEAYDALLEIRPDDGAALNNSSNLLRKLTRVDESSVRVERAAAGSGTSAVALFNRIRTRLQQGDAGGAREAVEAFRAGYPGHAYQAWATYLERLAAGERGGIERALEEFRDSPGGAPIVEQIPRFGAAAAIQEGRLGDALDWAGEVTAGVEVFFFAGFYPLAVGAPELHYWFLDDPDAAVAALDSWWGQSPETEDSTVRLPWGESVTLYAMSGRSDLAAAMLERWEEVATRAPSEAVHLSVARAMIGAAETPGDALVEVERAATTLACPRCFDVQKAVLLERLERYEEAITTWEEIRDRPLHVETIGFARALSRRKLGPLYEQAGDDAGALTAWRAFVDGWADADPALQPQVERARERIRALGG